MKKAILLLSINREILINRLRFGTISLRIYLKKRQSSLQLERENRFRWQLRIVHGSGHNETKMAEAAAKVLLTND